MPVKFSPIEIPLAEGLDQKTARLFRAPGVLRHVRNVDHRTGGMLRKRRGYQRVALEEITELTVDSTFRNLGLFRDELVVFGQDYAYALASRDGQINYGNEAIVRRGPTPRGGFKIQHVHAATLGDELS